jgi:LAS superfamily LD-carboxypeptidase LdcB
VSNIAKFPKYLILATLTVGLLLLGRSVVSIERATPTAPSAIQHAPPFATQIADALPELPSPTVTLPADSNSPALPAPPPIIQALPSLSAKLSVPGASARVVNKQRPYRTALAVRNSIAQKYDDIARQAGYLEQYPEISGAELTAYQGQRLSRDAARAFDRMRQAAARDGVRLTVVSGFRSISAQVAIFTGKGGDLRAAEYSAPPGHSQHHTGLAIDINSLSPSFRETTAFGWLRQHAAKYGFMLPYGNSQGDLGPYPEPWHWVYVAQPPAMQLMTDFISRARDSNYDPLLGDRQLESLYLSTTKVAVLPPSQRSKS